MLVWYVIRNIVLQHREREIDDLEQENNGMYWMDKIEKLYLLEVISSVFSAALSSSKLKMFSQ
jgi:hypothetical protein